MTKHAESRQLSRLLGKARKREKIVAPQEGSGGSLPGRVKSDSIISRAPTPRLTRHNPPPIVGAIFEEHPMDPFLQAALDEDHHDLREGGIRIGSVLDHYGRISGRGHNRRIQNGSAILHAEMHCLESAGRLKARDYQRAILYSTLSPCDMCSGTALLYKIPKIVIGENQTFRGPEDYVRSRGVELVILQNEVCIQLMRDFIAA